MEEFYIKENNRWSGPFTESEFRVKSAGKEEVDFWKTEFCPNHILHPALCSHHKTGKGQEKAEEIHEISQQEPKPETVEKTPDAVAEPETTIPEAPVAEPKEIVQEPLSDHTAESESEQTSTVPLSKPATVAVPDEEKKEAKPKEDTVSKPEEPDRPPSPPAHETVLETPQEKPTEIPASQNASANDKPGNYTKLAVIMIGFLLVILAGFYVNSRLSVMKYQDKIIRNYIEDVDVKTKLIAERQKILEQKVDSLDLWLSKTLNEKKEIKINRTNQKALLGLTPEVIRKAKALMRFGTDYSSKGYLINYPTRRYYAVVVSYNDLAFALMQRKYLYSLGFVNAKILVLKGLYAVSIEDGKTKSDRILLNAIERWNAFPCNEISPYLKKY